MRSFVFTRSVNPPTRYFVVGAGVWVGLGGAGLVVGCGRAVGGGAGMSAATWTLPVALAVTSRPMIQAVLPL